MRSHRFCVILVALLSAHSFAQTNDLVQLEAKCKAFELARLHADVPQMQELAWPGAVFMYESGRNFGSILDATKNRADRKKATGPYEPVRVVERVIRVNDNVAIVTELLGATLDVEAGKKIKPRRRMTTWVQRNGEWKVEAYHSSDYSQWEKSIVAFEESDANAASAPGKIVFIGSSSIRGWKTLTEDFPGLPVLRRGFGGSQLIDSIVYAHRIVRPYQPTAVAVYAGDNDVGQGKSAERVFHDFRMLVETIHATNPETRIGFIAIKPSIRRWEMWPTMNAANQMVANYAREHDRVTFLDIATPMLGDDGKPKPEFFVKDGLHMTAEGYAAWTKAILPWAQNR